MTGNERRDWDVAGMAALASDPEAAAAKPAQPAAVAAHPPALAAVGDGLAVRDRSCRG